MRNFALGALGMIAGAALWLVASIFAAFSAFDDGSADAVWCVAFVIGFIVMIAWPLAFWIVIPIKKRLRGGQSH